MNQAGMRTMFGATAWAAEKTPSRATQAGHPSPQQLCRRLEPLQCQSRDPDTHSGGWLALGTAQLMTQSCCCEPQYEAKAGWHNHPVPLLVPTQSRPSEPCSSPPAPACLLPLQLPGLLTPGISSWKFHSKAPSYQTSPKENELKQVSLAVV